MCRGTLAHWNEIENERPTTMRKKRMEDGWMLLDKVVVVLVMVVMLI